MAVRASVSFTTEPGDVEPGPLVALPGAGRPVQRGTHRPGAGSERLVRADQRLHGPARGGADPEEPRRGAREGRLGAPRREPHPGRPVVIRLLTYVRIPRDAHRRKITRRAVFARDRWTCQYCGHERGNLTVDHVIPRSKGGPSTWENIVTCCAPCNRRKGDRLPKQANMVPARAPRAPTRRSSSTWPRRRSRPAWEQYLVVAA